MKIGSVVAILCCGGLVEAQAQLEWIARPDPQMVFAGREVTLALTIHNTTDKSVEVPLRMRLFQTSSATSMPVSDARAWKTLKLLPGQTVLENVAVTCPTVKARTMFEIQWADAKGNPLGKTQAIVYPDDLLKQLATLAKDKPIGVVDSDNLLKPALKRFEVEFEDLESGTALDKYDGPLLIAFSADTRSPPLRHLGERIGSRAKDGVAIVWIHPLPRTDTAIEPHVDVLHLGRGVVVVAQPSTVSRLNDSPLSQLNLVHFAEIALNPNTLQLPETP